jgi:hypothetical protein
MSKLTTVITTIQQPTQCVHELHDRLSQEDSNLIIVGDKIGPKSYEVDGSPRLNFLSFSDQLECNYTMAAELPAGHYARKNLGYLTAIENGTECIYETDDDNGPNEFWQPRAYRTKARPATKAGWMNVYRLFSDERIWPRGYPLECLAADHGRETAGLAIDAPCFVDAPIQQGLADLSPDVDAIWRLTEDREIVFDRGDSIQLTPGTWCPFNSQSTWFWPVAFPLLYLPSYCSFRMTDIWRSFIAQRCIWELDTGIVFHAAEVEQQRNEHNLLHDFKGEVDGYLRNDELAKLLEATSLQPGADRVADNLYVCYEHLVAAKFFPEKELELVQAWLQDLATIAHQATSKPLAQAA